MHTITPPSPSTSQIIHSLILGSIAILIVGVQPILLGALVDARLLTLDAVGLMAMGEIVTLGLGAMLGGLLPLRHFRAIAMSSAAISALLNAATPLGSNATELIALRTLSGFAEGVLIWTSTCIIVRTPTPPRIAGIFMIMQTLAQAGVAMLLANMILPKTGWPGGFYLLGALSLGAAALGISQPRILAPLSSTRNDIATQPSWSTARAFPLIVIFLELAAIGALWAYFEPLGQAIGLPAQSSQNIISFVLIAQLAGAGAGTLLFKHTSVFAGLALACITVTCIALSIHALGFGEWTRFTELAVLFGFAWAFSFPFQIELCFKADPSGQIATFVPAAQLLGSALGPLIASLIVSNEDARPATWISALFGIAAASLLLARWRTSSNIPANTSDHPLPPSGLAPFQLSAHEKIAPAQCIQTPEMLAQPTTSSNQSAP